MRRFAIALILVAAAMLVAPQTPAQPKPKDPVLQQNILDRLAAVSAALETRLAALDQKLSGLEAELSRMKQAQADLMKQQGDAYAASRDLQNSVKANEVELRNLRVQSSGDILGLSNGLGNLRAELAILTDTVKRGFSAAGGTSAPTPAPVAPQRAGMTATIEGYVTAVDEDTQSVQINLGRAAGIQVGKQFGVYRTSDPSKNIGILEITQVVDDNNSKARIVYQATGIKFDFGDIVRPM